METPPSSHDLDPFQNSWFSNFWGRWLRKKTWFNKSSTMLLHCRHHHQWVSIFVSFVTSFILKDNAYKLYIKSTNIWILFQQQTMYQCITSISFVKPHDGI
jgi:hypothetical protein